MHGQNHIKQQNVSLLDDRFYLPNWFYVEYSYILDVNLRLIHYSTLHNLIFRYVKKIIIVKRLFMYCLSRGVIRRS